jgi:hypothetical protein
VTFVDNANGTATLSGTPAALTQNASPYGLTINAINGVPPNASQGFTLNVVCQPMTVTSTPATLPQLTYNVAIGAGSIDFNNTGGHGTITWSASGLPSGVSIDSSTGNLTGTPSATGSTSATITATDAFGCFGSASATIAVGPNLANDSYDDVGNTQLVAANQSAPTTPFVANANSAISNDQSDVAISVTAAAGAATTQGGSITINAAGAFTYTPPVGFTGTDSYLYTGTSNGVSATATISITVANKVWYVSHGSTGTHDGRSNTPFLDMGGGANNLDCTGGTAMGDFIYVAHGTANTTGACVLKANQSLIGAGATLNVPTASPILTVAGNAANTPTLTGTLTLANSVTTNGFDMSTGASSAIVGGAVSGVSVTARNLTSTTGTTVSLNGTGGTVTLTSVSANGATSGISLTNTTGTFSVAGAGGTCTSLASTCTGGTIQGTSSHGVAMSNAQNVSFSNIKVTNIALSGIYGTQVSNFTLTNSVVDGVNTSHTSSDADVAFNLNGGGATEDNLSGTVSITNNAINNSYQAGIDIYNYAGTISNLTITGNSFTSSTNATLSFGSAISVYANKNNAGANFASITAGSISNNTINNFPSGAGIQVLVGNVGTGPAGGNIASLANPLLIEDNTITGFGPAAAGMGTNGIAVTVGHQSDGFFTIGASGHPNTITNVKGDGVACSKFGNNSGTGTNASKCIIAFNLINANNTVNSPGINTGADSATANTNTPKLYLDIHDNNVMNTTGNGILSTIRSTDGTGIFNILNNTVARPTSASGTVYGIRADAGNGSESAGATVCLKIAGNTTTGSTNGTLTAPGIGLRDNHASGPVATFNIDGLTPNPASDGGPMEGYVNGQNPGSVAGTFGVGGTASISAGATFHAATCTIP